MEKVAMPLYKEMAYPNNDKSYEEKSQIKPLKDPHSIVIAQMLCCIEQNPWSL